MFADSVMKNGKLHLSVPSDSQLLEGVRLGMVFWEEAPMLVGLKTDVDRMIAFAYNKRADPMSFVNVASCNGDIVGFCIGSLAPFEYCEGTYAFDRMLYVDPQKRGLLAARMLVQSFEKWAKDNGALRVLLGITTGVHVERTEKLFNKLGYATVGALTMKEI
jgi:GNAT superfamily N-acetyltransferase